MRPIPLLTGVLLDESDGIADFLRSIILNILVCVAQRSCELKDGDAVLKLQALRDNAVTQERAVTGGVALYCAAAEDGRIVVDGYSGFCLGHRADIARKTVFLCNINIVYRRTLVEEDRNVGGSDLTAERNDGREAHHDRLHLVFVQKHDLL